MTLAPDPSDTTDAKTDAKADGNFGSAGSHRAGYGDKLANAERWARKGGTLNAGEGLILCEEIDRLRYELKHETQWADAGIDSTEFWQKQRDDLAAKLDGVESERDDLRDMVNAAQMAETVASAERDALREENKALHSRVLSGSLEDRSAIHKLQDVNLRHQEVNDRLLRILAALREPSIHIWEAAVFTLDAEQNMNSAIRAAVAAAEREVQGER